MTDARTPDILEPIAGLPFDATVERLAGAIAVHPIAAVLRRAGGPDARAEGLDPAQPILVQAVAP